MSRPPKAKSAARDSSTATIGFEATVLRGSASGQRAAILRSPQGNRWLAADSRGEAETAEGNQSNNMDAAEPERSGDSQPQAARRASEARQYKAENVFWVPAETRWSHLQANAKQATMARRWTTPGSSSSATTRASRAYCPRTTCVLAS